MTSSDPSERPRAWAQEITRAATPATSGVADDVPPFRLYPPPYFVVVMSEGATTSRMGP